MLSFREGIFLASLPYRRSFFSQGGWKKKKGPEHPEWKPFLKNFFLQKELILAQREADSYPPHFNLRLCGRVLPIQVLSFWDKTYPTPLSNIYDPPPVLFYWGDDWTNYKEYIAVVGTRRASPLCEAATKAFLEQKKKLHSASSSSFDKRNLCVVSGMAFGVDRMAHEAAAQNGLGNIAVLGSGLAQAGPRRNLYIIRQAQDRGNPFTLLTEFAPKVEPLPYYFPRRNRIIAGLVESVAVIQAPERSGALITARYALEEGRDVLVFDHPAFDHQPQSNDGGRALLDSGAEQIVLPELQKKMIQRPKASSPSSRQLSFWREEAKGLKRLGKDDYLKT